MSSSRLIYFLSLVVVLGIVSTMLLESQATPAGSAAVTYARGTLNASNPYRAPHAGSGRLTLEILDPEDQIVGRAQRDVSVSEVPVFRATIRVLAECR